MTKKEIEAKIKELWDKLENMEFSEETDEEREKLEDEVYALEEENENHEMSYDLTVKVRLKVNGIKARSEDEAEAIVYDMFKNNAYGVVEEIDSYVDEEHEIEEAV